MIAQLLIIGIASGSIYTLLGLAMTIVVSAVGVINFATGNMMMIGAFVSYTFIEMLGWPFYIAYPATLVVMALFGVVFERIAYYPLRKTSVLIIMIATMALGIVLQNVAQFIWGAIPLSIHGPFGNNVVRIGNVTILAQHILIIVVTVVLLIGQHFVFEKTNLGRQLRALAQDKVAAALMGIRVNMVTTFSWMYTSMLTGIAGILFAPAWFLNPSMGARTLYMAFSSIVIGGWGSVPGAIMGGMLIGIMEVFVSFFITTKYRDVFTFVILIIFLLFRPEGIFGEKIAEKV
jgi:branched-chain amino acid transport system permease protein